MADVKQTVKGLDVATGYVMAGTVCYRCWKIFSKLLVLCFLLYFLCLFSALNSYKINKFICVHLLYNFYKSFYHMNF